MKYYLVIDEGTTNIKAFIFSELGEIVAVSKKQAKKWSPKPGWVEQDAEEIFTLTCQVIEEVIELSKIDISEIVAAGITNQRETIVAWNKNTGKTYGPAIVWEDRRTQDFCNKLMETKRNNDLVRFKTGLFIDPYFSAPKINWMLKNFKLDKNNVLFGTIDSWVLWKMDDFSSSSSIFNGLAYAPLTDFSNASRTLLFDVKKMQWDEKLLELFDIEVGMLPLSQSSKYNFAVTNRFNDQEDIVFSGVMGDQQSALFAVPDLKVGSTKVTYGTGAFAMQFIGDEFKLINDLMTTIQPYSDGSKVGYALEGKVEGVGHSVEEVLDNPIKRHKIFLNIAHKVDEIIKKFPFKPSEIYVDGGVVKSDEMCQIQANISEINVLRPLITERTALGIAKLIGVKIKDDKIDIFTPGQFR